MVQQIFPWLTGGLAAYGYYAFARRPFSYPGTKAYFAASAVGGFVLGACGCYVVSSQRWRMSAGAKQSMDEEILAAFN